MKRSIFAVILALASASPVTASEFTAISGRTEFLGYLSGKDLTNRLYGLQLTVSADGTIQGQAAGSAVTGNWNWKDGFFCREMLWGDRGIPYNCQLVEIRNGSEMRFTIDGGAGDSASFRLR